MNTITQNGKAESHVYYAGPFQFYTFTSLPLAFKRGEE